MSNALVPSCVPGTRWTLTVRSGRGSAAAGPSTVATSVAASMRSSSVQIAPAASQSVVAGSARVTSARPAGATVISQPMLLGGVSRRAPVTAPWVTVKAWSRSVL